MGKFVSVLGVLALIGCSHSSSGGGGGQSKDFNHPNGIGLSILNAEAVNKISVWHFSDDPQFVAWNGQVLDIKTADSTVGNDDTICYIYNPGPGTFMSGTSYHATNGKGEHIDAAGVFGGMLQATSDQTSDYQIGLICLKKSNPVTMSDASRAMSGILKLTY